MTAYEAALAELTVPSRGRTLRYGEAPDQFGQLWPGSGDGPHPLLVLLHGGYWRDRYGLDVMNAMAADLSGAGFAVWNLEYRRVGSVGGGWPGTFGDVETGYRVLADSAAEYGLDTSRIGIIGHSAGGHLALWLAARLGRSPEVKARPAVVVGLAAVSDLIEAHRRRLSNDAAAEMLGTTFAADPDRYKAASPSALTPFGVRQLLVHGTADDSVPHEMSIRFRDTARASGDACELLLLDGVGHYELIDPRSQVWATIRNRIGEILRRQGR
ncbi:alpha/beta hydrolase fold domain-containing protein [Actinomadura nitritigenes]|uniref:alpha/beta hydrolase fold domain-containing protein n=1 Tax=Actinomadura nitritigenes TaxID=134602 RepID=UPI0036944AA2